MKVNPIKLSSTEKQKRLLSIFEDLKKKDVHEDSGFSADKEAIRKIFEATKNESFEDILVRLTLIDSMYSTQMNRRYYGLHELAERMMNLNSSKGKLNRDFLQFTKDYDTKPFTIKSERTNLFSEKYGIGKDGNDKGIAISLISKYAYFATGYEFPIYDSIACEMYPKIWEYCGWNKKEMKTLKSKDGDGAKTMAAYVEAINDLCERLGGVSYDHLDRVLWFVGKIRRGNLSLVLSREEYEWCTKNLRKCRAENGAFKFDIKQVELDELRFLKKETVLYSFFVLAKDIA